VAANTLHDEEALGKAYDGRLMKRLLRYLRPYRGPTLFAVILLLIGSATQVALPWLVQVAIDDYITKGNAAGFGWIVLGYLVVMLVSFGTTYGQTFITLWIGQKVQFDIRMQVFRHIQKLHLGYYDKNPVGRMLTRVTNDVNVLDELFSSGVVSIVGDIFTLVFIVAMLFYYDWRLALVTFVVLPLLVGASFVFRARVRDVYREVRLKTARLNAFLQEHLTGIRIVQLFTQEARTYEKFDRINTDLRTQHFRSVHYYAVFFPTVELIGTLSVGLLLYFGGRQIGLGLLTFGELVAFIQLVQRFYRPIQDLSEKYNILQ
jgi:ATP-binding cassette subfamily B multidrug efflux pump